MHLTDLERSLTTTYARRLRDPFMRAVRTYGLVSPGDKIAVCLSGGKDSLMLAMLMRMLAREIEYTPVFLVMDPGYTPAYRAHLEENAAALGLPLTVFTTDVLRVTARHAQAHPCFLCSKMRRGHLYAQAQALGCNRIALGHHYDDAIESILMGLLYGGQLQTMLPRLQSANFAGMELIRPLCLVREQAIIDWMQEAGLTFSSCGCPAATRETPTSRAKVKALIASLSAENPQVEANILNAIKNVKVSGLLGWQDPTGEKHSFLDAFSGEDRD